MNSQSPAQSLLFYLMAYKISDAIFALDRFCTFQKLAKQPYSVDQLAVSINLSASALQPLLDLLCSAGILSKTDNRYSLPDSLSHLLPLIKLENYFKNWHSDNQSLYQSLTSQSCNNNPLDTLQQDQALIKLYQEAMSVKTKTLALLLYRTGKLSSSQRILDLGGNDGSLALALSRLIRQANFLVVDRAENQTNFENKTSNHSNNIYFLADDLAAPTKIIPVLSNYDTIIISNLLHLLKQEEIATLLQCIKRHTTHCKLIIYDQFTHPNCNLGLANLMAVDWVNCGTNFNTDINSFTQEISKLGLTDFSTHTLPGLSGQMILVNMNI